MSFNTRLCKVPNPFFRLKKRFSRYLAISCTTGVISFLAALLMLHRGFSPLASLVVSVMASGLLNYGLLELWGFPHREGRLSWKRLAGSATVGAGAFLARLGVLTLCLHLFQSLQPYDKALALACAYSASFAIGYLLRCNVVFRH